MLKKILELIGDKTPISEQINANCSVCNRSLKNGGFKFKDIFSGSTFNLNQYFKNMESGYVCNHCAVFFKRELWLKYCDRNNKDGYFPLKKGGKKRAPANWVFFSHYFAKDEHKIVTNRQDWREYLLNPPKPPFCFVLSKVCKKHLIFLSEMAYNKYYYPIMFDEKIIYINVRLFKHCLDNFEKLYSLGLSKSSIKTGDYNPSILSKIDKNLFKKIETDIDLFRRMQSSYLEICEFIGAKNENTHD